jgi:hypothetical protein
MYTLNTKHTNTSITIYGTIDLVIDGTTKTYILDTLPELQELLLSGFNNSRKEETEKDFIKQIAAGNFAAARQYSSNDGFEYPLSLKTYESETVSLARAKGKVSPGSIEVIIKLEAGKDDIVSMSDNLKHIPGFHLVNEKPIPVTDSSGMPIAVKYIVSPLAK